MSCGKPHETPCDEVLADVYVFLDSECDKVQKEKIRHHLEECGPCLQKYGIEREVKALVARCCQQDVAPDSLRDKLRASLRAVISESITSTTVETGEATIETTRYQASFRVERRQR